MMRDDRAEEEMLERVESSRGRDADSSLQAQYEDCVLPDREWEHEEVS